MLAAPIRIDNTTVHASAGSGKTYLLVSRIIQLLLNGAEPGTILAITFTRKAAAEMRQRLLQRLFELAAADSAQLTQQLVALGATNDTHNQLLARKLYEQLLNAEQPVTTTTFHAFCQDLLRRFPLEANVPAGFELVERTGAIQDEAWEALMTEAAAEPDAPLASALERLFKQLSLNNTRQALQSFVQQRSDWWAYTRHQADPLDFAEQRLAMQLAIQPGEDPQQIFFTNHQLQDKYRQYLAYLLRRDGKTNAKLATQLQRGLDETFDLVTRYNAIRETFLTQKGTIRACTSSKEMIKVYGEQGALDFVTLHQQCAQSILATDERLAACYTWQITTVWYLAGEHLLQHYQRIKLEQRLLDFTDLEWKAYQLLNQNDNASWVQYKLDNRIGHLLIDEFQDTNPTQWQLLLPLLEEFAARQENAVNSVFLVGDAKQSIYRFRRAEPRLFKTASEWLQQRMQATRLPLNKSWRSSPAIMDFVNKVFSAGPLHEQLADFVPHETEHRALWGQVTLLPLVQHHKQEDAVQLEWRNPLLQPATATDEESPLTEGLQVADTIAQLVAQQTPVGHTDNARPIRYSDILILLRSRTHVSEFEHALRQKNIPYLGAERGTLLDALEIIDMVKLLQWLLSPYDNHALASILRSPLFALTDDDLFLLATTGKGNWFERLTALLADLPDSSPLGRAQQLLAGWLQLAGRLPVHDLLDRIYSEANVLQRYAAAFPPALKSRVASNLTRFLELALENDSGRYPSLTRFIYWLEELRQKSTEAPDEPPAEGQVDRVRLLTIHEAKGLEAAVVFLVDSARPLQRKTAYDALVDWSDSLDSPQTFLLTGHKDQLDAYSRQRQQQLFALEEREETNLLYVAVTRAKQCLYISGTAPLRRAEGSWYESICQQYNLEMTSMVETQLLQETGTAPVIVVAPQDKSLNDVSFDGRLSGVIRMPGPVREIAPSHTVNHHGIGQMLDEDGRQRGLLIHALLEKLTQQPDYPLSHLARQFGLTEQNTIFHDCLRETHQLLNKTELQTLFDRRFFHAAYNEVPLSYELEGQMVYGIIDRLLVTEGQILLIDYKTHRLAADIVPDLLAIYKPQIRFYVEGIKRLWPESVIKPYLLFTHSATLLPVDL